MSFADAVATGATTICRCWRVVRADGVASGYTDHDLDLSFEGVTFEAGASLDAGALERSTGLAVDNAAAVGALSASGLREDDILAGRYDGAAVTLWLVDWTDVAARKRLFEGSLGEIRREGQAFEAELRGLSEQLNRAEGRAFLRTCDAEFGDGRCGVDPAAHSVAATVLSVEANRRVRVAAPGAEGRFAKGRVRWLDGANAGLVHAVKTDLASGAERVVELWAEAPRPIAPGDGLELVAGCDKTFGACQTFGNVLNYRGFPHMPGDDWITTYPASGDVNDGARRD